MDNIQPNVTGPVGMGGGAPDVGNPTMPQVQQQQAPPPNPAQVAQVAQIAHDSQFGRMAKAILGQNSQYSVGPDGTLQNNPVPEKPGQFFRTLLGAALLGGAAGANGDPRQGFLGGFVRGGAAGMGQAQQQDQMKRQQAQNDFNNQQKVQQQNREQMLMNAQVANMHSEMVGRQHTSDLQDQALHDRHNAASAALESNLSSAGGVPAIIPVNGQASSEFTAPDLAAAYVKDPSILKGPQGFIRHFIDTTDSTDLTYNGTNWVDAAGKPVNMTDQTTVKAIDVPVDAMKTKIPTTGKDINAAYGGKLVDPDKTYQMSPLDMDALNTKRMSEAKQQAAIDLDKHRAATADVANRLKERELRDKEVGAGANPDGSTPDPEKIADAMHNGTGTFEQLTSGMGKDASLFRRQVALAFLKKYPNDNLEALKAYGKQASTASVQSQLVAARSLFGANGETGSLDTLENALRRVPKAFFPLGSKVLQDSAYQLGSPEMATVKALKTDLGTELAKFNVGGGNATSDHQIELFREQLNEAQTPEQVEQVLKDIRAISSKRLGAIVGPNPYIRYMTGDINDPVTRKPLGTNAATGLPEGNGQQIDAKTAAMFLKQAGGDKDKARQLAQQHKWVF